MCDHRPIVTRYKDNIDLENFKVKHGLVVEGTTATVNGDDIITATQSQTLSNKEFNGETKFHAANGAGIFKIDLNSTTGATTLTGNNGDHIFHESQQIIKSHSFIQSGESRMIKETIEQHYQKLCSYLNSKYPNRINYAWPNNAE